MPGQVQLRARTELDHAEARAARQDRAGTNRADNARYEGAGDLLDKKPQVRWIKGLPERAILLVDLSRSRIAGFPMTARQLSHFEQSSLLRKAVQMNAEERQINADLNSGAIPHAHFGQLLNVRDDAVGWGHKKAWSVGDGPMRVAEKPHDESCQQGRWYGRPRPPDSQSHSDQCKSSTVEKDFRKPHPGDRQQPARRIEPLFGCGHSGRIALSRHRPPPSIQKPPIPSSPVDSKHRYSQDKIVYFLYHQDYCCLRVRDKRPALPSEWGSNRPDDPIRSRGAACPRSSHSPRIR